MNLQHLKAQDPEVFNAVACELQRQQDSVELIASENIVSLAVLEAMGSVLTNKYAEGYPGKRYYGGCDYVDVSEQLAIDRACKLFNCSYANVQPYSGSIANLAAYYATINVGDTVLGMDLSNGGHLTHGSPANYSGHLYKAKSYALDENELINYDEVAKIAREVKPKLIIAGASAYPRKIDFSKFREIADEVGAKLLVDMAHIAGIVAAGRHMSPLPYADVVTTTTHKTLRGPRGGLILSDKEELFKKLDSAIFPGVQAGPLEHIIAAKAVAFGEALTDDFKTYIDNVLINAKAMGRGLESGGLRLVSGGTDNHLLLVDLTTTGISGKDAEDLIKEIGITSNKNTIPNEKRNAFVTSGIRLGSPAITTRGFTEDECERIGEIIAERLFDPKNETLKEKLACEVNEMLVAHPIYEDIKL